MTRKKVPLLLPQAHIVERFTCRGTTGWADEQLVILRRALTRAAWQLISRAQTSLGCLCCQEMMHRRPVAGPLQMRSPIWGMLVWYRRDRKMASAASPQTVRSRRWAVVAPAHGNHDEGRGWEGVVEVAEQPCCAAGCHLSEREREELERGEILGCLD